MAPRSLIDTTEYQDEMISRRRNVLVARTMWPSAIPSPSHRKEKEEITSHWNLFHKVAKVRIWGRDEAIVLRNPRGLMPYFGWP